MLCHNMSYDDTIARRMYNYKLTQARRMVECAFGILCNKWRIFHRAIDIRPEICHVIIKTRCILHNFVRQRDGLQFQDTLYECTLDSIKAVGTSGNVTGTAVREYFGKYFASPLGFVPWQYEKFEVHCTTNIENARTFFRTKTVQLKTQYMLLLYINMINFHMLPGDPYAMYRGESYVLVDAEEALKIINEFINPFTSPITEENIDIIHLRD